jgi:hypothetical protein
MDSVFPGVERVLVAASLPLSSILFSSAFRMRERSANWIGLFVVSAGQIVLASTLLSELHAISLSGFLGVQLVFLMLAAVAFVKRGARFDKAAYFWPAREILAFVVENRILALFGLCLVTILATMVLPVHTIGFKTSLLVISIPMTTVRWSSPPTLHSSICGRFWCSEAIEHSTSFNGSQECWQLSP